jgi:4-hydroxythreonine-4-phosphate dehydrogenase
LLLNKHKKQAMSLVKTILITMGDPSGIGPEIIVKSLSRIISREIDKKLKFIIVGDEFVLQKIKGYEKIKNRIVILDLNNVPHRNFSFGKIRLEYGKASLEYINTALELIKKEKIKALVTAPISKKAVSLVKKDFYGQTEYLAQKSQVKDFAMLLANDRLKISLVTRHIPLLKVAKEISIKKIYQTAVLTHRFLKICCLIKHPKIGISALNPHASDQGLIGKEEKIKIIPAVNRLRKIIDCSGPYPIDTILTMSLEGKFDAIIAMYHDQALIPLKLTGRKSGVNITLGLPFIRISPLHGVAFDIAGKDKADPSSMLSAINKAYYFLKNIF